MNPNYDPVKINAEKEAARRQAEADYAKAFKTDPATGDPTNTPTDGYQKKVLDLAQTLLQGIKDANPQTNAKWTNRLAELEKEAIAQAKADKLAELNGVDPKPDPPITELTEDQIAEAEAKGKTDAAAQLNTEWEAEMQSKAENAARQQLVNDDVAAKEADLIKTGGKYYKAPYPPAAGADVEFTNDLYVLDANGNPLKNPDGSYQYNAATFENDKFLLQVDPLKDRRDRLMIDPNTVSKESEVVELGDTVLYGKIQAQREMLTEEGEYASNADLNRDVGTGKTADPPRLSGDPDASKKRGIPYYQKALDSLARQFAEEFNQANQLPATTVYKTEDGGTGNSDDDIFVDAEGNPVTYKDETGNDVTIKVGDVTKVVQQQKVDEDGNPIVDAGGNPVMEDVRVPLTLEDVVNAADPEAAAEKYSQAGMMLNVLAQKGVKDPLYGFYDGGVLFSNNGNTNDPSGITASNITVSHGWATETVHVLNDKRPDSYREDGTVIEHSSRNDNIRHMITLFDKQLEYSAKDVQGDSAATDPIFKGSFREVYTTIEGILATDQNITEGKMNNYQVMTLSLENNRQSVSGVDLNDEATNMMQFSKSYAAACRLLTTIDSMLDKLINGTAI